MSLQNRLSTIEHRWTEYADDHSSWAHYWAYLDESGASGLTHALRCLDDVREHLCFAASAMSEHGVERCHDEPTIYYRTSGLVKDGARSVVIIEQRGRLDI